MKRTEEDDVKFSEYQVRGVLARGKIRSQIRDIEDRRKADRVHDLILNSPSKKVAEKMLARKVGQKYAIFDLDENEKPNSPVQPKRVRTVLDLIEPPESSPTRSSSSEDEFVDVSDAEEAEASEQNVSDLTSSQITNEREKFDLEKAIALSLLNIPQSSRSQGQPQSQSQPQGQSSQPLGLNLEVVKEARIQTAPIDLTGHTSDWSDNTDEESSTFVQQNEIDIKCPTEDIQLEQAIKMSLIDPPDDKIEIESSNFAPDGDVMIKPLLPTVTQSNEPSTPTSSTSSMNPEKASRQNILDSLKRQKAALLETQSNDQQKEIVDRLITHRAEPVNVKHPVDTSDTTCILLPTGSETTPDKTCSEQLDEIASQKNSHENIEKKIENIPRETFTAQSIMSENSKQRRKLETANRISSVPNQQLYLDSADLLDLFGVGIVFAPGEAEAQCACMEQAGVTAGTITEDGDTFLFGGKVVYRGLSVGKMIPIKYDVSKLEFKREEMLSIAQLTGSDYCAGIKGIGPKTAKKVIGKGYSIF